ncbi:MAG: hypothetical protein UR94_C0005G0001 [Parcubacteria group bacterium GW2011_GWA2_36_10]|nr:MAG: hypothetical protein UR94_C0005G0001 [Parcubacteria group bacterium GW2011_GWA2_36_10]KKT54115.1 MAG: hypothetical protein UW45_C0018G0001 [Parcubacteria group bacterium GW2011_GWC2_44_22]
MIYNSGRSFWNMSKTKKVILIILTAFLAVLLFLAGFFYYFYSIRYLVSLLRGDNIV